MDADVIDLAGGDRGHERVVITLGPLPSQAVLAWCSYARLSLNTLSVDDHPFELPRDIELQIRDCVQTLTDVAVSGPVFEWSTSADPERLKLLLHYWFNIAALLGEQARHRGWKSANADSRLVYEHLVDRLTAALPDGPFAERLRATWPGVGAGAAS